MRKGLFITPVLLAFFATAVSHFFLENSPRRAPAGVSSAKSLSPEVSRENIQHTIEYLASKKLGGRSSHSPGREKARDYIISKMKEYGYETELQRETSPLLWKGDVENIIAFKPGSNKNCVAFVAHYDHNPPMQGKFSPGANDNASGVAAVLELARVVKSLETQARVYFLFPDKEENFISGSKPLAKWLKNTCEKVDFSVTLDMVGVPFFPGFENHLLALGAESSPGVDELVSRATPQVSNSLQVLEGAIFLIELMNIPRSDYTNFRGEEIPFLFLTAGMPATYHTPYDSVDQIDFTLVAKTTVFLRELLNQYLDHRVLAPFKFVKDPEVDLAEQARGVAYLIEKMLSDPQGNQLTQDDITELREVVVTLRDSSSHFKKARLQLAVAKVIKIVIRRCPVPAAYFRSMFGKVMPNSDDWRAIFKSILTY